MTAGSSQHALCSVRGRGAALDTSPPASRATPWVPWPRVSSRLCHRRSRKRTTTCYPSPTRCCSYTASETWCWRPHKTGSRSVHYQLARIGSRSRCDPHRQYSCVAASALTLLVGVLLRPVQSGRHTSVYADWGDHFCTTQDAVQPTQAEADTQADFLDKYPYCRNLPGVRRRLAIGAGELDYAWQSLVRMPKFRPSVAHVVCEHRPDLRLAAM